MRNAIKVKHNDVKNLSRIYLRCLRVKDCRIQMPYLEYNEVDRREIVRNILPKRNFY
jgi:hypothetical protein